MPRRGVRALGVTLLVWAALVTVVAGTWAVTAYGSEDGPGSGSLSDQDIGMQRSLGQISQVDSRPRA